jgi:probable Rubsico expression protein CbbX
MDEPMTPPTHNGFAMRLPGEPRGFSETLQSASLIDVAAELRGLEIEPVLDRLDLELVGLATVKSRVHQITAFLLVDWLRSHYGLTSLRPTLHMCFTGAPGTGKTTIAGYMAEILKRLGYVERGHLIIVTEDALVRRSIGHTLARTNEVMKRALGGVLFIDEPYELHRTDNELDHGAEAIEVLVQAMENRREELVVILAGAKDRMDRFFQSTPNMTSRVPHRIDFPNYTLDDLCAIAELMLTDQRYEFSPQGRAAFRHCLERQMGQPRFANARTVRDALERARLTQANRILAGRDRRCSRRDLGLIEPDDILASEVTVGNPSTLVDPHP